MQVEVGKIVEGKVTGVTSFGAFMSLPEGKTGLVHISEIAHDYVKDINDHVKVGDIVRVKVVTMEPDGKISLSIKKTVEQQPQKPVDNGGGFDNMLASFMASSAERMKDVNRKIDPRKKKAN